MRRALFLASIPLPALCLLAASSAAQQLSPFSPAAPNKPQIISPLTQPTLSPGVLQLLELEARFSADVARGGGKAFASWFADDAVTLNDGKPATLGHLAIAASASWDPKTYQLTWTPQGAQMGPSGDTGFTWGHYEGRSTDRNGQPVLVSGRYITFWKKVRDGSKDGAWKVALDASASDSPDAGDCCVLPKP